MRTEDTVLTENAAKAAGIYVRTEVMRSGSDYVFAGMPMVPGAKEYLFNPLQNDAQVFRLAIYMSISVDMWEMPGADLISAGKLCPKTFELASFSTEPIAQDRFAAARRAIVRAAAAMVKAAA